MRRSSLQLLRFAGILSILALVLVTRVQASVNPANANASPAARTVLEYFHSLPSRNDNRVVSGQFGSYGDGTSYNTALQQIQRVYDLSGQYPAITGMDCATPAGMNEVVRYMTDMWNAGSLVTLSCHFRNPWTGGSSTDTANPDTPDQWDRRNVRDLITPGRPGYSSWIRMLDDLAVHLQTLENRGVIVMFRPLHELNGTWFWWGGQTPDDFRAFWRHMFDYFTRVKGLDNLLWVYSPNTGAGVMNNYPGDDVVDFVGLDEYMKVNEDPMQINGYGEYDALVASGKPVGLFEFGPIPASAESWNTTSYDWGKFIRDIRSRYPRLVLFQAWEYVWQIGYDRYRGQSTLMNDSWVVTRSELPRWSDGIVVPPATTAAPTSTTRPTNTPTRVPTTAVPSTNTSPTNVPPTNVPPTQNPGDVSDPIVSGRVTQGLQALYTFAEGSGSTVRDVSGAGSPINLTISQPSSVRWLAGGGLQINNLTLITNGGAPARLIDAAMASNELAIEAWVKPANTTQTGSARIVSMSNSPSGRNLTLGQLGNQYEGRIRTSGSTDGNASPAVLSPANSARTELTHLLVTRDAAGNARFYVNGVQQATAALGGDFGNWNRYLWFNLGNELTGDRQWLGEMHLVAVYTRALSANEVAQNFAAGARGTNAPTQPTSAPPTTVPTTAVPATSTVRPTNTPTRVPTTAVPPTSVSPTTVPPTGVPPTNVPPTVVVPTQNPGDVSDPIVSGRVTQGLQALYTFAEGSGSTVRDVSGAGSPINLTISQPSSVRWLAGGGLQINNLTLITNGGAPARLIDAAMASNELAIEAWVKPANTTQTGSARIVSMSNSPSGRNLTLGQLGSQYEGRIRTSGSTDGNASPAVLSPANSARTELTHLLVTRDAAGNARFYVNGVQQATATLGGDFGNWNRYLWFNLGNELTGDRQWLGEMHLVAVYTRALSANEVAQNFAAGARGTNAPMQPTSVPPTSVPTTAVPPTSTVQPTNTPTVIPPANTPTVIPPTNTPTQIPPTIVVPTTVPATSVAPTVVPTDTPVNPVTPIESDDARVERTRGWITLTSENASGGMYMINTRSQDALTLSFEGTGIEIVYVGGVFGSFAIEVDGQSVRTVTATMSDGELSFNNRAIIGDLQDGTHTLRILPQNSIVAIDAFVPVAATVAVAMLVEPSADLMAEPLADAEAQAFALPEQPPLDVAEALPAAFPTLDTVQALEESTAVPVTEEALPVEEPVQAVVDPSLPVLSAGTYESDDPAVGRTAGWSAIPHASASGGTYLMNSAADDTLAVSFKADTISVIYAQQPVAGEFVLEIDGQAVQQINGSSSVEAMGIVATVDGLASGVHTLRVLPLGGAAAIDAFVVGGAVVANPAEILPEQPQVFPTLDVQVLPPESQPPVAEVPAEMPVEPTPVPQILPLPAFADMEDGALNWTTTGAWEIARDEANPLVGTHWTTTPAENQSGSLMWYANFDLSTAQRPVLGFQSWLTATASQAVIEVSVDGINWLPVSVIAPSAGWTPVEVDLTAYAGQLISFRLVWIQGTAADSWKVDDVSVADIPLPPEMLVTAPAAPTLAPPVEAPAAPPNSEPIPEVPVEPAVAPAPEDVKADVAAAEATEPAQP